MLYSDLRHNDGTCFSLNALSVFVQIRAVLKDVIQHSFSIQRINALKKTHLVKTEIFGLSSPSIKLLEGVEQIQLLVQYLILLENSRKFFCRFARALLPAHLNAIRLSVLPLTIGRKQSFFYEGYKFCSNKNLKFSGTLPSPIKFRSLVGYFKKLSPQARLVY